MSKTRALLEEWQLSRKKTSDYVEIKGFNDDNKKIEELAKSLDSEIEKLQDASEKPIEDMKLHKKDKATKTKLGHVMVGDRLSVTAEGVLSADIQSTDTSHLETKADATAHKTNITNPHKVNKEQVGLGNVQNYGVATKAEAESGTSNSKYMTPARTKDAIEKMGRRGTVTSVNDKGPNASGNVDLGELVHSVAGIAPDEKGDVPLIIGDLTVSDHLPPTAPPREYPLGITTFRCSLAQSSDWRKLVNDGSTNSYVLVVTFKAHNTFQATQTIYLVDGTIGTGDTIRHRAMYVRSAMASTQSSANQWSEPVKLLSGHDLSDSNTSDSSDTIATSKAVKNLNDTLIGMDDDLRNHKLAKGGWKKAGHVELSNLTSSTSSDVDGVAATPYAVNQVRKLADEAQKKAEQAFTLGDKQRDTLAGSLSSKGVDLPTNPSWDRLQSEIVRLKNVKKATIEVSEGQTVINIGFDPDALNVMSEDILDTASVNFSLDGGYFVLGDAFDSSRYPFVVAKETITITGKGSPVNFTLTAYSGLN